MLLPGNSPARPARVAADFAVGTDLSSIWRWLPVFVVVSELGSLGKAATFLRRSVSTLSRSVQMLEQATGVELFDRTTSGMVLTSQGRALHDYAVGSFRELLGQVETLRATLDLTQ